MIPVRDRDLVAAVLDTLVPVDEQPGATQAGALEWLDAGSCDRHAALWSELLCPGFDALAAEAVAPSELDELLRTLERQGSREGWSVAPSGFVAALVELAAQAYYGQADSPSWQAIGYVPGPKRPPLAPVEHVSLTSRRLGELAGSYDVVIAGAGAGGGVAAMVLSDAGARVLLVDRGSFMPYVQVGRDHLANQRLALYGHNAGPEPLENERVYAPPGGPERVVERPFDADWHNNAMTVGGGTRVYQGIAWRYQPDDFRMASRYGVPEASSLADWPLTYDELEPYYTRAEQELGVCGDGAAHLLQGHRSADYPLPALPENPEAAVLRRGAEALGLCTGPVPLLINSRPYGGRAACVACGECVGFACPSDAKNGTHNTVIPRALASESCTLASGIRVERVHVSRSGRAAGVALRDLATGQRREIAAGAVVVSAGAIESARLLLASATSDFPAGLGNRSDQLGRNLQGHVYVGAHGLFDELVQDSHGPGVSIATTDFSHGLQGDGIGGGVLYNECVRLPILFWYWALAPAAPRWGAAGKRAMRELYARTSHILGPVQEIPSPEARVTLAQDLKDRYGNPVARLSGEIHPETVRAAHALRDRAERWMRACGALRVWTSPPAAGLSAGQHQAGTARMGEDPASSVTDPHGRVHGHPGLWVMDGSLHVTNGGANPALTIMALAYRCAERLAQRGD